MSNGTSTFCYRTTSLALFSIAFAPFERQAEVVLDEEDASDVEDLPTALADTGFDNGLLVLMAMIMSGFGILALRYSRRRD
jgi:hypothetical protein